MTRFAGMDDDIMELSKWPQSSKSCLLFLLIFYLSLRFFFIVRSKFLLLNNISKKKSLHSQVNDMTKTTDTPKSRIPFDILILFKIVTNRTAKCIVRTCIIANNRSELLYDAVVLESWKKRSKLLLSTMAGYRRKSKQSFWEFILIVDKIGTNAKEEKLI